MMNVRKKVLVEVEISGHEADIKRDVEIWARIETDGKGRMNDTSFLKYKIVSMDDIIESPDIPKTGINWDKPWKTGSPV